MLCVVSVPMAWLNQGLTGFIDGLGTQNLVLTGMVIGGMMAVDLGGPINKVAYTFAVAAISNGNYYPMAAAMVGGVVPPLGVALATTLFKKKFTKDQQIQGKTYYLLGASFITESCMPVCVNRSSSHDPGRNHWFCSCRRTCNVIPDFPSSTTWRNLRNTSGRRSDQSEIIIFSSNYNWNVGIRTDHWIYKKTIKRAGGIR